MRRRTLAALVAAGALSVAFAPGASGHFVGDYGCDNAKGWVSYNWSASPDRNGDGIICVNYSKGRLRDNHVHN